MLYSVSYTYCDFYWRYDSNHVLGKVLTSHFYYLYNNSKYPIASNAWKVTKERGRQGISWVTTAQVQ